MKVIGLISAILFIWFAASAGAGGSLHSFFVATMLASCFVLAQILGGGECGTGGGGGGGTPTFSISPTSGPAAGGTAVTITGTGANNFVGPGTVTFGGTAATNVVVVNSNTITCTTPAHAAGAVTVVVTAGGAAETLTNGFTYTAPPQPIYGGVGLAGATSGTLSGTTVTLDNGATLPQLQTTPEVAGTSSWSFSPNNQVIYLLLRGSGHTIFRDTNTGFAFPFNTPPIAIPNIGGSTLYLYQCRNAVFTPPGPYQILVVN